LVLFEFRLELVVLVLKLFHKLLELTHAVLSLKDIRLLLLSELRKLSVEFGLQFIKLLLEHVGGVFVLEKFLFESGILL